MTISVVIPTYNRRYSLARCLDSVLRQSHSPNEIIVVNDGSTDGTSDWIREHYSDIHLIEQPNQGVSGARNAGIQAATGQWVAFLDSDDCWLPGKLEAQLSAIARKPDCALCHTEEIWVRNGKIKTPPPAYRKQGGFIFEYCLSLCAISPSTAIIRRSLFDEVGFFDESLPACEDYDLWLRICSRYPVVLVRDALIEKHGGHSDQLSSQRGLDEFRIQAIDKLLQAPKLPREYRKQAIDTLCSKCAIIAMAAKKSGRLTDMRRFQRIAERHKPYA